mgnify:CR=1 FL=1
MRARSAISLGVVALMFVGVGAHAATAWFGIPVPKGMGNPHAPVVDVANVRVPPARVPPGEERYMELRGERIKADVAKIVDFSRESRRAGDRVWGRVTGFPAAKRTIEWVAARFRDAGLEQVEVQEYAAAPETPMWWASSWEVRLIGDRAYGADTHDVVLESAVPTSGSMIEGPSLEGPLVFAGSVGEALPAIDMKGKIAVQRVKPQRSAYSERRPTVERANALAAQGAIAVLNVVEQTGNMHVRDFSNCRVPCFNLGAEDGTFVQSVIERAAASGTAPVRVELTLAASRLSGLKGHNAVGIVHGTSDENIIVNAHADGWYDAAGDNADGLAVLLAMARHFAKLEHKPQRTLVFVASGGHHSAGLNGPANFVRANQAITAKTVMVVNLEHVAQLEIVPGQWIVKASEQPMSFGIDNASPFLHALGRRAMERYGFNLNPNFTNSVPGDLGGYAPLGVARVQAIHSGPMYHVSGDVLETISIPGLERAARFFTYFVAEAAKAARSEINPPKSAE